MKKMLISLALLVSLLIVVYAFVKYKEAKTRNIFPEAITKASPSLAYVPDNLQSSFEVLIKGWPEDKLKVFKNTKEEDLKNYDFKTGKQHILSFWGLNSDSRFARYFNKMGIYNSEDMFYIIMASLHRYLNNKDIKLQEQLDYYRKLENK